MATRQLFPAGEAQIASPKAAPASGELILHAALGPVRVMGLNLADVAIGDYITVQHNKGPTIEVAKDSADTFAAAAVVDLDESAQLAVPDADAASDGQLGKALEAAGSGTTVVKVILD